MVNRSELISVIIPVYNVAPYLERCLFSVVNNTYKNLDIICINDGSTDESLDILKSFQQKDNRIRVVSQENQGLSAARNTGLRCLAKESRFISFIGSDDWIHPQFFEILLNLAKKTSSDLIVGGYAKETEFIGEDLLIDVDKVKAQILFDDQIYHNRTVSAGYVWGRLYKRELIDGICFRKDFLFEDSYYNMEVFTSHLDMKCALADTTLYHYYMREGSLMTKASPMATYQLSSAYKKYIETCVVPDPAKYYYLIEILKCGYVYRYVGRVQNHTKYQRENKQNIKYA